MPGQEGRSDKPIAFLQPWALQYRWTKHVDVNNTHVEPTQPMQHLAMLTKHDSATHHKQEAAPLGLNS